MVCAKASSKLTPPTILANTKGKTYLEIYTPNNTYVIDQFINSNPDCPFDKPTVEARHDGKQGYASTKEIKIEVIDKPPS